MRETFVVEVLDAQNGAWQGVVTWLEGKSSQPFRSTLELLRLMDSGIQAGGTQPEE